MAHIFFKLDGKCPVPCGLKDWAEFVEQANRTVAVDRVAGAEVSTVFLGLDHRYLGEGDPILFETMVFGGPLNGEMERYCTWEQAEAGHKAMIERVKACKQS